MGRSSRDLIRLIVGEILKINPQVGQTIDRATIASILEEDPESRRFKLAFHDARDELVENSPSMVFKVNREKRGNYIRISDAERADLGGRRYLNKARKAAHRGIRRVARTDTTQLSSDEKRLHEHRLVQTGNAFTGINDAIKRSQQPRWPSAGELSPQPQPRFTSMPDTPKKPAGPRWLTDAGPGKTEDKPT